MAAAATVVAAVLVAWGIGTRSVWLDEAFSVEIAGGTWAHLWERLTTREGNMGLHYVLLHAWIVLGRDEATIRALSAVAVVAAVPLTHRLGVRLVGAWAGAVGALLLATHPFVVRFGQEARGYALALLLVVAASLALVRALDRGTSARWAAWAAASVLAAYAHVLTLLVMAAELLAGGRRVRAAPVVAVIVLVAPMLWFVTARDTGQIAWLEPPSRAQLAWVASKLTGDAGGLGMTAYVVAGLLAARRGGFGVRFLVAWMVLPFVVALVVSFAKPLFLDRYFLMLVPALVLLVAAGLEGLPARWRTLAAAGFVAMHLAGVVRTAREPSIEDWRGVAAALQAGSQPGDAAACWVDFACVSLDYYAGGPPIVWLAQAVDDPTALAAIADAHPRLWLAVSHVQVGQADRTAMLARIEAELAARYALADTRDFTGVVLRRYDRR